MATSSRPLALPLGPNGNPVSGRVEINSDGTSKWYKLGDRFPTLESNSGNKYQWRFVEEASITNLRNTINTASGRTVYQSNSDLNQAFYSNTRSTSTLNQARLQTFKSPTGLNSPQLAEQLGLPGTTNIERSQIDEDGTGGTSPTPPSPDGSNTTVAEIGQNSISRVTSSIEDNFGNIPLRYPENIAGTGQDYIKFEVLEYGGKNITRSGGRIDDPLGPRNIGATTLSTIYLPIQSGITDENSAQWGGESLDAITAYFAGKSLQAMEQGPGNAIRDFAGDIEGALNDPVYANALKVYLAGQAVGTNNLLSRATGTIVNPNLELLFQGPQLRPFNFNFKLSPRTEGESKRVKAIIRAFKVASAVKVVEPTLFLKAPNVFKISYIDGESGNSHKSINQIKTCALTNVSVNYTPLNTYMTFNDPEKSMVSYDLSLRFSELDPVTNKDYIDGHPVGF